MEKSVVALNHLYLKTSVANFFHTLFYCILDTSQFQDQSSLPSEKKKSKHKGCCKCNIFNVILHSLFEFMMNPIEFLNK